MTREYLPYGRQSLDREDLEAVIEVLRGDWLTTGPNVDAFEEALSRISSTEHAVAVSSGTAALHAAYDAAGVGPGTEVVVPAITFSATANTARHLGARVRFADVREDTLTMDPESLRSVVNAKTRVVTPVDFAGLPADLEEIGDIAHEAGAVVVEDAAHSLGGSYAGRPVGAVADMTTFSFHPVKVVTTGEGGAVVTDRPDWAERMRRFRNHGMDRETESLSEDPMGGPWVYDIEDIGYNYRITDFQCALGRSQLRKLDRFLSSRRQIAEWYRRRLTTVAEVRLPVELADRKHAYHLFYVRVPSNVRRGIFERFHANGIGVQVHYIPVNMLSAYCREGHDPHETPVAMQAYREMISLPCFPEMDEADVDRVTDTLLTSLDDFDL